MTVKFCNGPYSRHIGYATFREAEHNARQIYKRKGYGAVYSAPECGQGMLLAVIAKDANGHIWTDLSSDGAKLI